MWTKLLVKPGLNIWHNMEVHVLHFRKPGCLSFTRSPKIWTSMFYNKENMDFHVLHEYIKSGGPEFTQRYNMWTSAFYLFYIEFLKNSTRFLTSNSSIGYTPALVTRWTTNLSLDKKPTGYSRWPVNLIGLIILNG